MFKSVTLKLTLWYVLLATLLSVIFSVVLFHFSSHELREALNQQYNAITTNDNDADNRSLARHVQSEHTSHLLGELVYFNIVVVIGSAVVGYFLARRTLRPIKSAHEAQIRFTAEASHELRTPLAAMRADTETALMESGLNAKSHRTLKGNLKDIDRLEQLSSRLLDISRLQAKVTIRHELINLDEIITEAVRVVKSRQIKTGLRPVQINGDSQTLRQLIGILIDNAIKYSDPNKRIDIELASEGQKAVVIIKDKGRGIPAADLPHVFEQFYRAKNVATSQGYGLGLPLAQEIVAAHHGTIEINSQENKGTTITVKLPLIR